uniref:Uncharacterized protein n=1 Tax=Arundo donax TaxID=35708 RepID=A0A0A8Z135_ARUDO
MRTSRFEVCFEKKQPTLIPQFKLCCLKLMVFCRRGCNTFLSHCFFVPDYIF